jgi:hypothetical protein
LLLLLFQKKGIQDQDYQKKINIIMTTISTTEHTKPEVPEGASEIDVGFTVTVTVAFG